MSGQRTRSVLDADHRSAFPNVRGVPWWGAVLIAVTATAAGFAYDAGSSNKELSTVFAALYVTGCVTAVLAVRRSGIFTAVVQPPLILFVSVPGAYFLFHGARWTGVKDILINCGYPLIERFLLMLSTSAVVLVIGVIRRYLGKSKRSAADSDTAGEAAKGRLGRSATPSPRCQASSRGRRRTTRKTNCRGGVVSNRRARRPRIPHHRRGQATGAGHFPAFACGGDRSHRAGRRAPPANPDHSAGARADVRPASSPHIHYAGRPAARPTRTRGRYERPDRYERRPLPTAGPLRAPGSTSAGCPRAAGATTAGPVERTIRRSRRPLPTGHTGRRGHTEPGHTGCHRLAARGRTAVARTIRFRGCAIAAAVRTTKVARNSATPAGPGRGRPRPGSTTS